MTEKSLKNLDKEVPAEQVRLSRHEHLFRDYYKPLVVYAMRFLGDQQEAEDVVQDMFLRLWNKNELLEKNETTTSYLFVAVKNSCFNKQRHEKVKHRYENYMKWSGAGESESPHHYMMLKEIEQCIDETLSKLPERTQEIFLLSRYEKKKHKEIADILNISIKTVEAHIGKVLSILRGKLKNYISILIIYLFTI